MKPFIAVVFIFFVFLTNCDGRTSKKEQLKKSVSEFNQQLEHSEKKNVFPKNHAKIETDSLVANTFNVKIKNYTIRDSFLIIDDSVDDNFYTHHRKFESDILVTVQDDLIFKRHISAETFSLTPNSGFWKNATLEHVWVNQDNSDSEFLSLGISIINPSSKRFKYYEMRVDKYGQETLELIEEST